MPDACLIWHALVDIFALAGACSGRVLFIFLPDSPTLPQHLSHCWHICTPYPHRPLAVSPATYSSHWHHHCTWLCHWQPQHQPPHSCLYTQIVQAHAKTSNQTNWPGWSVQCMYSCLILSSLPHALAAGILPESRRHHAKEMFWYQKNSVNTNETVYNNMR